MAVLGFPSEVTVKSPVFAFCVVLACGDLGAQAGVWQPATGRVQIPIGPDAEAVRSDAVRRYLRGVPSFKFAGRWGRTQRAALDYAVAGLNPAARLADSTVLYRSIVIVIGPTPPGTGVMSEAFSFTASKSTSPTRR